MKTIKEAIIFGGEKMKKLILVVLIVLMIVSVSVITYNKNSEEEPIHTEEAMI